MKELNLKIKYTNKVADLSPLDIKQALTYVFGINTEFEVEELETQEMKDVASANCVLPIAD